MKQLIRDVGHQAVVAGFLGADASDVSKVRSGTKSRVGGKLIDRAIAAGMHYRFFYDDELGPDPHWADYFTGVLPEHVRDRLEAPVLERVRVTQAMRADRLAERTADYGAHHPVVDEFAAAEPEATGDELEALRRTFRNGGAPVSLLIVRQAWLELRQERETPRRRRR